MSTYHEFETPRDAHVAVFADDADKKLKKDDTHSDSGTSADSQDKKKKKGKEAPPPKSFAFRSLYRYAKPFDKLLLAVGILMATFNGALFPMMAIVFGNVLTGFATTPVDIDAVNRAALDYFLIAIGLFFSDYLAYITFYYTAERQMKALRGEALKHMLYLDIAWYDTHDALQLSSRLTGDTIKIKEGMGQKLGDLFRFTTQFFVGFIIGFARGWDITLVMAAIMPFMAMSMTWLIKTMRAKSEWAQKVYAEAGAVAEETLGQIRTVASLNAERRALVKYNEKTLVAEKENIQLAKYVSIVFAVFLGSIWVMYSVGLWYGGHRVSQDKTTPAHVFQAFFGVLMGSASLAQISPNLTSVAQATGSAQALFKILDTASAIDASKDDGVIPETCEGAIEVVDVNFTYPTRPEAPVLKDYNLKIEAGQTVAFVGSSGGGKSTLVSLLERFYDPTSGQIFLDGRDIKDINVRWLRQQIGIVQQEPVLFQTTIYENIAAGGKDVTREQAVEAAKMANAHKFIMSLPQQYDTLVGEKGVSLSGGQKQRVAIARAIVRNPKILVLDEATSALDNESERIVQAALNDLMAKTSMTTLVIAHRLSTVRHADKIVVLSGGHIVENGKHEELLELEHGIYRTMYKMQELKSKEEEADADDEDEVEAPSHTPKSAGNDRLGRSSHVSTQSDKSIMHVEKNDIEKPVFTMWDIFQLSAPERRYFYTGMLGAAVSGFALPCSALLVSGMITSMTEKYGKYVTTKDRSYLDDLYSDVQLYGIGYLVGAVLLMFFMWLQSYSFKYMMEKIVTRLRDINFRALCRQNVGFFDEKANATGALTADLNTNATKVSLMSGDSQARVVQAFFTLTTAIVVSFATGHWLLTLIMLAVFPLLVTGQWFRMRQIHRRNAISDELAEPGAHASERLSNIRTVVSLGLEEKSSERFMELLEEPMKKGHTEAQINAVTLGMSSFIMMAVYALVFWYGGKLVQKGDATFGQVIRTLMAIMMSLQGVTGAASYFGDSAAAYKAGATIMGLRNREVPIDSFSEDGLRPEKVEGRLEFRDISFRYPTRSEISVLKRYNLTIEPGQTVAFCGPSGGGKSTIISLIERFYDPIRGQVLLDGKDLKTLNVTWLRDQIGLVGQEPVLFSGTIAENIAYGLQTKPSQEEIEAAAKMANAHDYITRFPDGYETLVGNKGEQLSGGQKQRIAIARAILKDPNILLLDEATSALDSESEKVVQEALDKVVALKKRTTIIIAHRLSTIRKANKICVVSGGRIAEQGTHTELLARPDGIYARLVSKGQGNSQ
ncbi:hypothetical protein Poli38472_013195 [Pythium oligandrum]|uniref:Uncharacterized protein n=1 Tax=Pythium oligandrum TaxID=41045 RepID=A0A8K1FBY9_PYTOL|nr:hypothetical protein Poli38472_013195 [Pythium oligandrum]|eukprot:TMW55304.1 hypothetical protein Poli38472_013195 [Pythium oligandrum]